MRLGIHIGPRRKPVEGAPSIQHGLTHRADHLRHIGGQQLHIGNARHRATIIAVWLNDQKCRHAAFRDASAHPKLIVQVVRQPFMLHKHGRIWPRRRRQKQKPGDGVVDRVGGDDRTGESDLRDGNPAEFFVRRFGDWKVRLRVIREEIGVYRWSGLGIGRANEQEADVQGCENNRQKREFYDRLHLNNSSASIP